MAKISKKLKIFLLIILILLISCGGVYLLMYLDVIKTPSLLQSLPMINDRVADKSQVQPKTELEKLSEENDKLKEDISAQNREIKTLKAKVADLNKQLKVAEQTQAQYKNDIADMNYQLNNEVDQNSPSTTYKDMASYFAEMKAQNAADILSKLDDKDIIGILNAMEKDTAADLLQKMDKAKAAGLTKQMLITAP